MRKRVLTALALAGVLAACGAEVREGEVVKKWHAEPYTWVSYICVTIGKNPCGSQVPIFHNEPERWWITLEDCEHRDDDGDCPRSDWHLDQDVWNGLHRGDWYKVPKD